MKKILEKNKGLVVVVVIALVLVGLVYFFIPPEAERFTFVMPIFAGVILYMILTTSEKDL